MIQIHYVSFKNKNSFVLGKNIYENIQRIDIKFKSCKASKFVRLSTHRNVSGQFLLLHFQQ